MEIIKITLLTACIGFGSLSYASDLTVTNTFEAYTPASAAEVNQNFDDVKRAVDDNNARISENQNSISSNTSSITDNATSISTLRQGISVYDGEIRVGALLTYLVNVHALFFMSDEGYIEHYVPEVYDSISFLTTNCTGQAYYYPNFSLPSSNGFVVSTTNSGLYEKVYVQPSAIVTAVVLQSHLNNDVCTTSSGGGSSSYYEALPNDEAITGFPNSYSGSLRIGY